MDPVIVTQLAEAWALDLVGAVCAGARPAATGVELVFDRPPEGTRPGRRSLLALRLGTPVWAWTGPLSAERGAAPWAWRPAEAATLRTLDAPGGDRRLVLTLDAHVVHLELWSPGNLLVTDLAGRIAWCARTRDASSFRAAIAAGETYAPPKAPVARHPAHVPAAEWAAWLVASPADPGERLSRLARDFAGLPKGLLEALAPTLPRGLLVPGEIDAGAAASLAVQLLAWSEASYAAQPPVRGYAWTWPSAGATLLTRALTLPPPAEGAPRFVGSFGSWSEAARGMAIALPAPIDAGRVAAARAAIKRLERAQEAVRTEIAGAAGAADVRADATALAAFLPRVTRGAASVTLPDPADPARTRTVALDPALAPHENVDRLFKRAGKLDRVAAQAPARLAALALETERARLELSAAERGEPAPAGARVRRGDRAGAVAGGAAPPARRKKDDVPSALVPRKFKTREGWEVWIGKSNLGNDHLTHRLARSEDVWMHVHGAAGSHVVLRRGKGPNEPSKATLEEVAGWAAFYSQARNAGTVPVTVTQKKYVTKPRQSPAGLAHVMRSKTVFARPTEPPDEARVDGE